MIFALSDRSANPVSLTAPTPPGCLIPEATAPKSLIGLWWPPRRKQKQMTDHRAIDLWVNADMGEGAPPEYLQRVKEDYFKGGDDFFRSLSIDETIQQMDEAGVERAVLSTSVAV